MTVPGLVGAGRKATALALSVLDRLGLAPLAHRSYPTLSGGERQKVQIARALCQLEGASQFPEGGRVLFVDEPTSSLDVAHQIAVLKELGRQAATGRAVFAVLHDLNLASAFADCVVLLSGGGILASGTPNAVLTDDNLSRAYDCRVRVNTVPDGSRPYTLPQMCDVS